MTHDRLAEIRAMDLDAVARELLTALDEALQVVRDAGRFRDLHNQDSRAIRELQSQIAALRSVQPKPLTEEQIEDAAVEYMEWCDGRYNQRVAFRQGARWAVRTLAATPAPEPK